MAETGTHPDFSLSEHRDRGSLVYVLFISFVAAVGGFLFGFDTGVISGAITFVTEHFQLNAHQEGFAVSNLMIACALGALVVGTLTDRFGRKKILIIAALLFFISALMSAFPQTFTGLVIGRFVGGLAVGIASVVSPMYIAEISPAHMRGRLVAINQLAIVIGILSTFFSNWLLVDIGPNNWRWMFAVGAFPSGIFFLFLLFIPESPRWLVKQGKVDIAFAILSRVGGSNHAETEIKEIKSTIEKEEGSIVELWKKPGLRKALWVGILLALFAHITGIDTITYYGPVIFMKAGFESASSALLATVLLGINSLIFVIIGMSLVDRFGRKPLMLIGMIGMGISLAYTGYTFQSDTIGAIWIIVPIITYLASFQISIGVVIWVYLSEIFPTKVRGRAMSIATFILWFSNVIVTQTFPWMIENLKGKTFYLYSGICFIAFLFVLFMLAETKGKTLEEIERMWER